MAGSTVPLRQSLSYRQTQSTVLVAFAIGVVLSSVQICLDYFSQQNEMRDAVGNMLNTANRAAYHAAYNLDDLGAQQITRGLVSTLPVVEARIFDDSGKTLGQATRSQQEVSKLARWVFGAPHTLSMQLFNAERYSEPVGKLLVTVDPALNAATFVQRSLVVFASGVLRNFFLALCVLVVLYLTITRPILQASRPLQQGITHRRIPVPGDHADDEIGVLLNAFNAHLDTIEDQHQQIIAHNLTLEKDVFERTRELGEKNAELEQQREQAVAASQAKSDFLAMMSHEIRTPMHGMLGMAELLQQSALSDRQRGWVEAIVDSGQSLQTLLNTVLDYARYEQGKLTFETIAFDLSRMLRGIAFLMSPLADEKGLVLESRIASDCPRVVVGDPEKLRQVLLNLLNNAIKFTARGKVTLSVSCRQKGVATRLRFAVSDTGPGLSNAAKDRVFDAFVQADSSVSRRFGGSGLGLAIAREIITRQQGKIGVDSEPGQGSCFWFELDFDVADSVAVADEDVAITPNNTAAPARCANVLVVDDVAINRTLVQGQLARHRVLVAANGWEALDMLAQHPVDLVLMDLHMPELDGLATTRAIRALSVPGQQPMPVVGVTANVTPKVQRAAQHAGMDAVLSKPLGQAYLVDLIDSVLGDSTAAHAPRLTALLDEDLMREHREALGDESVTALYQQAAEGAQEQLEILRCQGDVEAAAHTLAGLCGNFGMVALAEAARNIEQAPASLTQARIEAMTYVLDLSQQKITMCLHSTGDRQDD
ncbi:MAG: hypothetical protein CSA53_04625 [Gammaproteobacteria bacterium]|nr:MAG: hypothetical protein CSA53_04625 [Gammaproteobacteria bacterium]